MESGLFAPGAFFTGCNYWASHAGTNMWVDWDPATVEADLFALREAKLQVLRIFPLWPDFQPIRLLRGAGGRPREIRLGEAPLPPTDAGRAGVDPVMVERFGIFLDLAQKYELRLIVGLLTGWMSGRLFVPPALEGLNILTDPLALQWSLRFVKYMVTRFRDHPAIAAWDLGNECNCMGQADSPAQSYVWTAAVSDAIRVCDPSRPVISGLHGLTPEGNWPPREHAECVDILTTHPYPLFTPYCDTDPLNRMKSQLHAAAQTLYYRGLGGKPCFAEEAGTLGPMLAGEEVAADYVNNSLYSLWAHGCQGFLWWCANEQSALTHAPYDWDAVERELGLFRLDGSPKPVLHTLTDFTRNVWHVGPLPPRLTDGVCVLTRGQDTWRAAFGCFLLARQAGLDIEFAWAEDELPDAPLYLLPALSGGASLSRRAMQALLARVKAGATLYLSLDDALLSPFAEFTGLTVQTRGRAARPIQVTMAETREKFTLTPSFALELEAKTAQALASDREGNPAFAVNSYGQGSVYLLTCPIERMAAETPGILDGPDAAELYRFYAALHARNPEKVAAGSEPCVGVTEHVQDNDTRLLVVINYLPQEKRAQIRLSGTWRFQNILGAPGDAAVKAGGDGFSVTLPPNRAVTVLLKR